VLYSLGDPLSLVLLLAGFLLAVTVHGVVQALVAARVGDRRPAAEGRRSLDPRAHVDPFGAVAGLIAGIGWAKPVEPPDRRRRGAMVAVLVSGAVADIVLGLLALLALRLVVGPVGGLGGYAILLQQGVDADDLLAQALLLIGLSLLFFGALALVPLPPLPGGRLLFGLAPQTLGWQKAEHQLVERNIGVAVLLALLLIPLGGPLPLLPTLLDTVLAPVVDLVIGG
jgi:Zn-dependent protease